MKKSVVTFFAAVALFSLAQVAGAYDGQVTLVGGSGYGPYQAGSGGEFTFEATGSLAAYVSLYAPTTSNLLGGLYTPNFQTFCLEEQEYISAYGTYNATLNSKAINGGLPPNAGGDPISLGTAWLYQQFAMGTLSGYDYSGHTTAAGLQNAIWYLEDEIGNPGSNPFIDMVDTTFGSFAAAQADNNSTCGVEALNLFNLDGSLAQDQLILVPGTGTSVPEPGSMLLLGFGLVGLVGFRRKFKK